MVCPEIPGEVAAWPTKFRKKLSQDSSTLLGSASQALWSSSRYTLLVPSRKLSVSLERGTGRGTGAAFDLSDVEWKHLVWEEGRTLDWESVLRMASFAREEPLLNQTIALIDDLRLTTNPENDPLNNSIKILKKRNKVDKSNLLYNISCKAHTQSLEIWSENNLLFRYFISDLTHSDHEIKLETPKITDRLNKFQFVREYKHKNYEIKAKLRGRREGKRTSWIKDGGAFFTEVTEKEREK